jgi:hypothetical protein
MKTSKQVENENLWRKGTQRDTKKNKVKRYKEKRQRRNAEENWEMKQTLEVNLLAPEFGI